MLRFIAIIYFSVVLTTVLCYNAEDQNFYRKFEKFDLDSLCNGIPETVTKECSDQLIESCKNRTVLFNSKYLTFDLL